MRGEGGSRKGEEMEGEGEVRGEGRSYRGEREGRGRGEVGKEGRRDDLP